MKRWLVVLMVAGLMAASLSGCGSKQPTTNTPATPGTSQVPTPTGTDLSSIMKSASAVKEMSYDSVTTMTSKQGTMTSTGKFYLSNGKMRMEMVSSGVKMITIVKSATEVYLYNPATNTAMKLTTSQNKPDLPNKWAKDSGDTTGYQVLGSESKDGYDCWVVQYTDPANASNTSKMWLRKDIGLPVRVESTTADGTVVMEYSNYNLGAQDSSLFDVPAGAQITTMPSIPNLPQLPQ
jgi:outer membrane lipoprotein-sorting protein